LAQMVGYHAASGKKAGPSQEAYDFFPSTSDLAPRAMQHMLRGCKTACASCNDSETAGEEPLKLKVCTWAEEEVNTLDVEPPRYGFLGRVTAVGGSHATSAHGSSRSSSSAAPSSPPASPPSRTRSLGKSLAEAVEPSGKRMSASSLAASLVGPMWRRGRQHLYEPGALTPLYRLDSNGKMRGESAVNIADIYEMDAEPLGRGSYGEVMGATHRRTGARRAIKVVAKAGLQRYVHDVDGFVRREVDILRRLDHPNVVRLYEAYEDSANIYIVLEVCGGGDLLERVTVACDRMPEHAAANLMVQMLSSVQHLGLRGIVHRDLKPENFLFSDREPRREPLPPSASPLKLIDFGLSRRLGFAAGARMTPKIGTTEYMAPEAFAGNIDPTLADRTDVWSLGVVLHVIFIGHFPSPMIAEVSMDEYIALPCWSHISSAGRELMALLLCKDPRRRLSVSAALKHRWLGNFISVTARGVEAGRQLAPTLRLHAQGVALRRLVLAFAAREVDDSSYQDLRELYQALTIVCEGALTAKSLEQVSTYLHPQLRSLTEELLLNFDSMDLDGSGTIDWTEFLAAAIGGATVMASTSGPLLPMSTDVCWRTFDLLSQGGAGISSHSLGILFQGGAIGSDTSPSQGPEALTSTAAGLQDIINKVDHRGVGRSAYLSVLTDR